MAIREVCMCDKPDCRELAVAACPLCGQDCCTSHFSERLGLRLAVLVGDNRPLGSCTIGICAYCYSVLNPPPLPPGSHVIAGGFPGGGLLSPGPAPSTPPAFPLFQPPGIPLANPLPSPFDEFTKKQREALLEVTRAYLAAQALGK
jgi:hypothetical protein